MFYIAKKYFRLGVNMEQDIKIIVATHKKYQMPTEEIYIYQYM